MPSVIIVSDSHGLTGELNSIQKRHEHEVDSFIHCGDSELDFNSQQMNLYKKVRGNCDFDANYPKEIDFQVDSLKFYVTHGHLYNVKMNLLSLFYRAEEVGAQVACFGHSHLAGVEKIKDTLFINPGSIRQPRGGIAGRVPTYVRLSWNNERKVVIEFLNLEGQLVEELREQL